MIRKAFLIGLMVMMVSGIGVSLVHAQGKEVLVGMVYGFTGPEATCGWRYFEGEQLAIKEINAKGGLLGRKITFFTLDTESKPSVSVAAMRKAVEKNPFVIFGTCFSSSTIVNMAVLKEAGIPQLTSSQADKITEMGNDYIFRSAYKSSLDAKKFMKFIAESLKVKKLATVYVNDEYGVAGRDGILKYSKDYGIDVVLALPATAGQADFTGEIAKIKASEAECVYSYLEEDTIVRFVKQANTYGLDKQMKIVGSQESSLLAEKVGEAANGYISFKGVDPMMPAAQEFSKNYEKEWGRPPIGGSIYGYMLAGVMKAIVERTKSFDRKKFKDALHGATICAKDEPKVLVDVYYDENGDNDRESAIAYVDEGKAKFLTMVPAFEPERFKKCKK